MMTAVCDIAGKKKNASIPSQKEFASISAIAIVATAVAILCEADPVGECLSRGLSEIAVRDPILPKSNGLSRHLELIRSANFWMLLCK
jgi:hypothetical protein